MIKPLAVKALPNYRVYIKYSDGAEGEIDLSDLVGQGIFEAWRDCHFFEKVRVGGGRQIRWSDEIELCPDALYMKLTGKTPEELFPKLKRELSYA